MSARIRGPTFARGRAFAAADVHAPPGSSITKPVAILGDVKENGYYTSNRARFSPDIDARKLGYNPTELPPGSVQYPFHSQREEEETFPILEGEGELRFGERRYRIRRRDVIACPPGSAEVAHLIINTDTATMRYLSISAMSTTAVCECPGAGKVGVVATTSAESRLRKMFRGEARVEYYDRESTQPPRGGA